MKTIGVFCIKFACILAVFLLFLKIPYANSILMGYVYALALIVSWLFTACNIPTEVLKASQAVVVRLTENGYVTHNITTVCTSYYLVAVYLALIIAYPGSLKSKIIKGAIGALLISLANIVRLMILGFVNLWTPHLFSIMHFILGVFVRPLEKVH